jgi:hypothetical protein
MALEVSSRTSRALPRVAPLEGWFDTWRETGRIDPALVYPESIKRRPVCGIQLDSPGTKRAEDAFWIEKVGNGYRIQISWVDLAVPALLAPLTNTPPTAGNFVTLQWDLSVVRSHDSASTCVCSNPDFFLSRCQCVARHEWGKASEPTVRRRSYEPATAQLRLLTEVANVLRCGSEDRDEKYCRAQPSSQQDLGLLTTQANAILTRLAQRNGLRLIHFVDSEQNSDVSPVILSALMEAHSFTPETKIHTEFQRILSGSHYSLDETQHVRLGKLGYARFCEPERRMTDRCNQVIVVARLLGLPAPYLERTLEAVLQAEECIAWRGDQKGAVEELDHLLGVAFGCDSKQLRVACLNMDRKGIRQTPRTNTDLPVEMYRVLRSGNDREKRQIIETVVREPHKIPALLILTQLCGDVSPIRMEHHSGRGEHQQAIYGTKIIASAGPRHIRVVEASTDRAHALKRAQVRFLGRCFRVDISGLLAK